MKKGVKMMLVGALSLTMFAACSNKEEGTKPVDNKEKQEVTKEKPVEKRHESYTKYEKQIADVKKAVDKYQDVDVAIKEGFLPASPYVPGMGFHFVNMKAKVDDPTKPNTLLYTLDKDKKMVLAGAEWAIFGDEVKRPDIFDGIEWSKIAEAGGHYEDGTLLPAKTPQEAPKTNPETTAKLVEWRPALYAVHMYTHIENPDGVFAEYNKTLTEKYDKNAVGVTAPPVKLPTTK